MKAIQKNLLLSAILLLSLSPLTALADDNPAISTRNLGGPRFGMTFVPGNSQMVDELDYHGMGRTISQFGMGPNLTFSKTIPNLDPTDPGYTDGGDVQGRTSLLLAVGKSFNYGGVSIPINVAYTTSPEGNRVSLIFGYAIGSTKDTP